MKKEGRVVVVSSRERKRAGEDGHTHTLNETQRLDSIEISIFRSNTGRNHSELSSTTIYNKLMREDSNKKEREREIDQVIEP